MNSMTWGTQEPNNFVLTPCLFMWMAQLQLRAFPLDWYDCLVLQSTVLQGAVYKVIPLD